MYGPYEGSPEVANRLNAARRAAGFKSVRAAALAHGWSEATLRAHETANGYIDEEFFRGYAKAFGVHEQWLSRGTGQGPATDPVRQARFSARIATGREQAEATKQAGMRLRLARRAAGYDSVLAAAEGLGVNRTTISAHETAQNAISLESAHFYAAAFGCRVEWLLTGSLPCGLGSAIEAGLDGLLKMHGEREATVRGLFAQMRATGVTKPRLGEFAYPKAKAKRPPAAQEDVFEVSVIELLRAISRKREPRPTGRAFSFPQGYLGSELGCGPLTATIVTNGPGQTGAGARILIDRSVTSLNGADAFVLLRPDGELLVATEVDQRPGKWIVAGKVCAIWRRFDPVTP